MKLIKIISLAMALLVVLNLILFLLGKISPIVFWIIMAVFALLAYKVMPKIKK